MDAMMKFMVSNNITIICSNDDIPNMKHGMHKYFFTVAESICQNRYVYKKILRMKKYVFVKI